MNDYILYGAGKNGISILDRIGRENVICFLDEKKAGGNIYGVPIISIDSLGKDLLTKQIIITPSSQRTASEIATILETKGIKNFYFVDEIKKIFPEAKATFFNGLTLTFPPVTPKKHLWNVNSQFGEDGILSWVFNSIGFKGGIAVEFGGWNGIYLSNIRKLADDNSLNSIYIEGDKNKYEEGLTIFGGRKDVQFINEYVGLGDSFKTLDCILQEHAIPNDIEVLSIDIDGYDYWVWDSLKEYRPRVIVIEYNPTVSNDVLMITPQKEISGLGSSAKAIVELGKKKHYELVETTVTNCIFVNEEDFKKMGIVDNSLHALRSIDEYCRHLPITDYEGRLVHSDY